MDIYLPIAEVSVNWPTLVILGAVVGFVSGLFGIGGGFLMAPILVFLGIPPTVAVASQASHVVASSTSGVIRYAGAGAVDFKMGSVMAAGGAVGPATVRSRPASSSPIQPSGRSPRPTTSSEPTMLRTM